MQSMKNELWTVMSNATLRNAVSRYAMPFHSMRCHAMPSHTMQCHVRPLHTLQCHATPCNRGRKSLIIHAFVGTYQKQLVQRGETIHSFQHLAVAWPQFRTQTWCKDPHLLPWTSRSRPPMPRIPSRVCSPIFSNLPRTTAMENGRIHRLRGCL